MRLRTLVSPVVLTATLQACGSGNADTTNGAGGTSNARGSSASGGESSGAASTGSGGASGATTSGGSGVVTSAGGSTSASRTSGGTASSSAGSSTSGSGSTGGTCTVPGATGTALAFPEAEGFGRQATGGRAGKVVHVTNLNDSGAGSFRDAVSASNRIVVFDVGGYIALQTAISVSSDITIAGQTAPGGGIGIKGGEVSFASSSNIICRHLRVRPGSDTASSTDDALSLFRASNVIVDHTSLEFAPWNDIDGVSDDWQNHPATNVTFQDSLIANPTGQQFGAHTESVQSQWSWYRNVFANSHNRNPLAKVNTVFVNNVLYDYNAGYTTHTSTNFEHDIVNNYFVFGPATTGTDDTWFQVDKNQSIYYAGNLKDTNMNGVLDGATTTPFWYQGPGTILSAAWSTVAATSYTAPSAFRITVSQVGALPRDPVDALVVSQMQTIGKGPKGTGANSGGDLYTSQTQTGLSNNGYGDIATGTASKDTDGDGMPDFWESATGSDPSKDDAMTKASDGYALVEHYVNWLAEPHAQTKVGASVDVDLSALTLGFSSVSPTFTVSQPACATAQLQSDGHTARFTPSAGFIGVSSFGFTVKGSDGTTFTGHVGVLVTP
jgi:hypothetical protein